MRRVIIVTLSMSLVEHVDFGAIAEQNERHEELQGQELREELFTTFRTALDNPDASWEDLLHIKVLDTTEHEWYRSDGEDAEEEDEVYLRDDEDDEEEDEWEPRVVLVNPQIVQENETSAQEVGTDRLSWSVGEDTVGISDLNVTWSWDVAGEE